ncbi:MAG: hypothetical protein MR335_01240 [Bacilli bacterium]|nr:hypothetical protein [Bacilli bacterium]
MKTSKKIMLLPVLALMSLTVASCGNNNASSGTESKGTDPVLTDKKDTEAVTEKEETKYQVSFTKDEKVSVEVTGLTEGKALPGSEVSFTVASTEVEILSVTSSSAHLVQDEGSYVFTMPSHDVTIEVVSEGFGDPSVLDVKDIDATSIPNNVSSFKSYFEKAIATEGTYFKSAHVVNNGLVGSIAWQDYDVKAGKNDVLSIKGHKKNYASDTVSTFFSQEIGRQNDIYYSISSSSALNSSSSAVSKDYVFKDIIADDSEAVGMTQIKESDAKASYSAFGGANAIYKLFFSQSATFGLLDYVDSPKNYNHYLKDIDKAVSEDKKVITFDLKAYYFSYSGTDRFDISFSFDGNNFMRSAKVAKLTFDSEDCDSTTKLPNENAVGKKGASYEITMERGYKTTSEKTDISVFAMNDYDIDIAYSLNGDEHTTEKDNIVVGNGSTLKLSFNSKDMKDSLVTPHLARVEEGEGFVDLSTMQVLKEGEFTLVIDNGFGAEKKIKIKSVRPAVASIFVSAPSNIFMNETSSMTVQVLPEKATQDVTFTKKDGATGDVEIKKNDDGTYAVKGTKTGEVSFTVASTENTDVKEDIIFTVVERPNAAAFKANAFAKTFYGESDQFKGVVNFNEDGTGAFKTSTTGYWASFEAEQSFNWTFDEKTLTFTITGTSESYAGGRGFTSFVAVTVDEAKGSFIDYDYSENATPFTLTLRAQDRKDLTEFN